MASSASRSERRPSAVREDGTESDDVAVKLLRAPVYWLFHHWRLFGYNFVLPPLLYYRPLKTAAAIAAYASVHRRLWWQQSVHRFFGFGASRRHKIFNDYKDLIKDDKRYLFSLHPHSVLADGWHSVIARNLGSFGDSDEPGPPSIGRRIALCFAPIIQHVPVHQEMYRDKCGGADKKSITWWWKNSDADPALLPGGFAESVFANARKKDVEYSYIKDRKGFIRICLEERKDIVPIYTFGATHMYNNSPYLRGWRARFSQSYFLPMALPSGWLGTSMPLTDETTTVVFAPFEVTKYTLEQLDECHRDYMDHLKTYFDKYKAECGMADTELVFIGNDFQDEDAVANALRSMSLMSKL